MTRITALPPKGYVDPDDEFGIEDIAGGQTASVTMAEIKLAALPTPADLVSGAPSDWSEQSYFPTATGFDLVSTSFEGYYSQVGIILNWRLEFTWASDSTGGGDFEISLPVPATGFEGQIVGMGTVLDDSTGDTQIIYAVISSDASKLALVTNNPLAPVTDTVPFTLAVDDHFILAGTYGV